MFDEVDQFCRGLLVPVADLKKCRTLPRREYGYVSLPDSYANRKSWNDATKRRIMSSLSSGASCESSLLSLMMSGFVTE